MAGYNSQVRGNNGFGGGASGSNKTSSGSGNKPVLTQLMKPSKSGKAVATFTVGDKALVIPANTRVSIMELNDKRKEALAAAAEKKGFKSAIPTHELVAFEISDKK